MPRNDPGEDALIRQWTVEDGRTGSPHVGSWVDIGAILGKVDKDEPLTRLERRVLRAHVNREAKRSAKGMIRDGQGIATKAAT